MFVSECPGVKRIFTLTFPRSRSISIFIFLLGRTSSVSRNRNCSCFHNESFISAGFDSGSHASGRSEKKTLYCITPFTYFYLDCYNAQDVIDYFV